MTVTSSFCDLCHRPLGIHDVSRVAYDEQQAMVFLVCPPPLKPNPNRKKSRKAPHHDEATDLE